MRRFFAEPETVRSIERLGSSDELAVYAGAGTSREVGVAEWSTLVARLWEVALQEQGWADSVDLLQKKADNESEPVLAQIVQEFIGDTDRLREALKECLFQHIAAPEDLLPGELALAVAALYKAWDPAPDAPSRDQQPFWLLTTNYDDLLEKAIAFAFGKPRSAVKSYVRRQQAPTGSPSVFHLHGRVFGKASAGRPLLTEGDYQKSQNGSPSWQEQLLVDLLNERPVLFVGTSMTDPNLIRYLHRHRREFGENVRHVALMRRGWDRADPELSDRQVEAELRWEQAQQARWEALNTQVLYCDSYADTSQYLHELAQLKQGLGGADLVARLDAYSDALVAAGGPLDLTDRDSYSRSQAVLQSALQELADNVCSVLEPHATGRPVVSVGLFSYWGSDPQQEEAVVVATSDRVMKDPATMQPIPMKRESGWVGVEAMLQGRPVDDTPDTYASRWHAVRALPLFRDQPRTPVGSVVLSFGNANTLAAFGALEGDELAAVDARLRTDSIGLLEGTIAAPGVPGTVTGDE